KLAVHKNGVHGPRKLCGICNKSFVNGYVLKKHVKSVHDKVSFACDQCGKRFTERRNMILHKKTFHEGQRPFHCTSCDKRFTQKHHLENHVGSVHLDDAQKKFVCTFCGKGSSNKTDFAKHLLTHSQLREHSC